jgi:hypothetical protein
MPGLQGSCSAQDDDDNRVTPHTLNGMYWVHNFFILQFYLVGRKQEALLLFTKIAIGRGCDQLSLVMGLLLGTMCSKKPKNRSQYSDTTAGRLQHSYTPLVDGSHVPSKLYSS